MPNFKDMDAFIHEQHLKHQNFINMYLIVMAGRFGICGFAEGVHCDMPDLDRPSNMACSNVPIRDLFTNIYTLKAKDGKIYICMMPETNLSASKVRQRLLQNGINVVDVTEHSPIGNVLILINVNGIY